MVNVISACGMLAARNRQTHTYAILEVSPKAFNEIADKLRAADYGHCFHEDGERIVIDMHGIALQSANADESQTVATAQRSANTECFE